jgi:hypothetical protein
MGVRGAGGIVADASGSPGWRGYLRPVQAVFAEPAGLRGAGRGGVWGLVVAGVVVLDEGVVAAGSRRVEKILGQSMTPLHGSEAEVGPGEVAAIAPGHDAEVVGDESCVWVNFGEISEHAKR